MLLALVLQRLPLQNTESKFLTSRVSISRLKLFFFILLSVEHVHKKTFCSVSQLSYSEAGGQAQHPPPPPRSNTYCNLISSSREHHHLKTRFLTLTAFENTQGSPGKAAQFSAPAPWSPVSWSTHDRGGGPSGPQAQVVGSKLRAVCSSLVGLRTHSPFRSLCQGVRDPRRP